MAVAKKSARAQKKVEAEPQIDESNRRADIEAYLDAKGVKWRYRPNTPLSEFDSTKSLRNQARVFTQLDEAVVDRYAAAVTRGDKFPPVIAHKPNGRGKLVNIDGNHRFFGFDRANVDAIDVYEISGADPQTVTLMTFEANAKHGMPTNVDERVYQAIWLMDSGASMKQAAAAVGVSEKAIKKQWNKVQSDRRADEVGLVRTEWERLAGSVRDRLASISTDEGFKAAAQLAYRANLDAAEVFSLVSEINQSRSGRHQEAIVKGYEKVYADRISATGGGVMGGKGAGRRSHTPKQRLNLALANITALPKDVKQIAASYAEAERDEAAVRLEETATRLIDLAKALRG